MNVSKTVLTVIAVLVLLAADIGAAAAQDSEMVWTYSRYPKDDFGAASSSLTFGIPETDAVQFVALCGPGSSDAQVEVGADVGTLAEDSPIDVRFAGPGYAETLRGTVVGTGRDEGIVGARLSLPTDDPLWQALRTEPALVYGVPGHGQHQLPLGGAGDPVTRFVQDCRSYAGDAPGPSDGGAQVGAPIDTQAACASWAWLRSTPSGEAVSVTFVNRSGGYRGVLWIDFKGLPQQYASLNPGDAFSVLTYVGHPWMFTDGPGNCLEIYMPNAAERKFDITARNRNFGDE